jgi:hypothetical protein
MIAPSGDCLDRGAGIADGTRRASGHYAKPQQARASGARCVHAGVQKSSRDIRVADGPMSRYGDLRCAIE